MGVVEYYFVGMVVDILVAVVGDQIYDLVDVENYHRIAVVHSIHPSVRHGHYVHVKLPIVDLVRHAHHVHVKHPIDDSVHYAHHVHVDLPIDDLAWLSATIERTSKANLSTFRRQSDATLKHLSATIERK